MEVMLPSFALCLAGLVLGAVTLGPRRSLHLGRVLHEAACRLGLATFTGRRKLGARGRVDGFEVELESAPRGLSEPDEVVTISVTSSSLPRTLCLTTTDAWTMLGQLFSRERVWTYDGTFDTEICVEGDELLATALLDQETRRAVLRAVRGLGARIWCGKLELEVTAGMRAAHSGADLAAVVADLVALAKRLSVLGPSITERLSEIAASDRHAAVRAKSLGLLLESFPGSPAAEAACRRALSDPSYDLRLVAATQLGAEGLAVLVALSNDAGAPEAARLRALAVLARTAPREDAVRALEGHLEGSCPALALGALAWLAQLGCLPVAKLGALDALAATEDPAMLEALARLVEVDRVAGEPLRARLEALSLARLGRGPAAAAQAIEILGRAGSIAAVEPLLDVQRRRLGEASLKRAARDAILRIQSRLEGRARGGLALAEDDGGALSLESAGELSEPDDVG